MAFTGTGSVTEARRAAAEILADMRHGEMLDPAFELRAVTLDARDRRWTQELVYGMLRRRSMLDALLSERVRGGLVRLDPDLGDLLRLGAYQLLHMRSVPAYAAIAQTVELTKERHGLGASKLANAVLRRLDRESDALDVPVPTDPVDALALRYSHPRCSSPVGWGRWARGDGAVAGGEQRRGAVVVRPYNIVREQLEATLESSVSRSSMRLSHATLSRSRVPYRSPSWVPIDKDCSSSRIRPPRWSRSTPRCRRGRKSPTSVQLPAGRRWSSRARQIWSLVAIAPCSAFSACLGTRVGWMLATCWRSLPTRVPRRFVR